MKRTYTVTSWQHAAEAWRTACLLCIAIVIALSVRLAVVQTALDQAHTRIINQAHAYVGGAQ